ncbi:MAG: hypothetical protein OIN84_04105 [Candidatus Methanoperedens sp.]|uniref:hypothetical protein n=1 Tax=Candidatus Methanoperedens sp. BLZ2 TaxID=2035255 RepID=UPI000BE3D6D6|nr:hypothetical protein [Candidatus Methanoperedens sp. BLZ2]KAB2940873.1 MAG: hypothetical protein F9K14_18950 [Candidatus Methanoperedens sp.]MBZ0177227.1 hypothetical protein [Candidatus Methanoperedens nitroreducens]MCX9077138.1 hypothetical protein [Candidatus Methanoperedens sp.]
MKGFEDAGIHAPAPAIDDDKKPQMKADERRYIPITRFGEIIHHKERKAAQQESLRSLRLKVFSTPARAPPAVHLRTSRAGG